jgi:peptidoglycan/xylan/chitin deacetylase (PgdA/CDA1 family)
MFHRVHPCPERHLYHDNYFSECGLIALLEHCLRSGVDVVDIDEALRRLREDSPRYFVILTFDDGYRDNYTRVRPIMNRFGLPFTVFVCSSIIERTFDYWWGGLVELFKSCDDVDLEPMNVSFRLRNQKERETALHRVIKWVDEDVAIRSGELRETFRRYGVSPSDLLDQDAMTRREVQTLSEDPLATIGGHGFSHRPLAALTETDAKREIVLNREHLEKITGQQVIHFAYPFGGQAACNWREAELVRSAGYRTAFTTRIGNLFPQHSTDPYMLPRGAMHPRRGETYHAEAQFAGVHRFLKSRGGEPIHADTLPRNSALAS